MNFEFYAREVEEMSSAGLEAIVGPYCFPNGIDGRGIFHDSIARNNRTKVFYLSKHELKMYVFLIGGTSARSWDVFPISSEPSQGGSGRLFLPRKIVCQKGREVSV